jgi:hypothetical protein
MSGFAFYNQNIAGVAQSVVNLNGLAASANWKSSAISGIDPADSSNQSLYDALTIGVTIITGSGTLGTTPVLNVYWAPSLPDTTLFDTGNGYMDNATAGDGTWTPPATPMSTLLGSITLDSAASYKKGKFTITDVPPSGVLWIQNLSGLPLASTGNSVVVKPRRRAMRAM